MKMYRFLTRTIAAVALTTLIGLTSAAGTAQAGLVMNGTFGFGPFGNLSYTAAGAPISAATTITIPARELVNTVPDNYLGNPNLLVPLVIPGDAVTVTPLTLNTVSGADVITSYLTFTTADGNRFQYNMASIVWTTSASSNLSFNSLGTFHDTAGTYNDAAASLSGSFTQTGGPSGTVNGSFTFATPPAPAGAPEPASFVVMLGMFAGLAVLSRRLRQK